MTRRLWVVLLLLLVAGAWGAVFLWPLGPSRGLPRALRGPSESRLISETEKDAVPPLLAAAWGHGREASVRKVPSLHGATEERVLAELGEPNRTYEFPVEDGGDEFRIELWNTYPPGRPQSEGVRILEWEWRYKEFSFAAWFHKVGGRWVVLDTCLWKKGVAF
jgi:hypothetical protein